MTDSPAVADEDAVAYSAESPARRTPGRPSGQAEGEIREAILQAAARLFADAGYVGTSVQAIVDAAGTTKPMVYYYFRNKEGLYREVVETSYGRVRTHLEAIPRTGDLEMRLTAVVDANFGLYRESPYLARFYLIPVLSPRKDAPRVDVEALGAANYRLIHEILEEGVAAGDIAGPSTEVALALTGMIAIPILTQFVLNDPGMVDAEAARRLVKRLLDGIRPRE